MAPGTRNHPTHHARPLDLSLEGKHHADRPQEGEVEAVPTGAALAEVAPIGAVAMETAGAIDPVVGADDDLSEADRKEVQTQVEVQVRVKTQTLTKRGMTLPLDDLRYR